MRIWIVLSYLHMDLSDVRSILSHEPHLINMIGSLIFPMYYLYSTAGEFLGILRNYFDNSIMIKSNQVIKFDDWLETKAMKRGSKQGIKKVQWIPVTVEISNISHLTLTQFKYKVLITCLLGRIRLNLLLVSFPILQLL